MNSLLRSFQLHKLVAAGLLILALHGAVLVSGVQPANPVHAADVCDGTCG